METVKYFYLNELGRKHFVFLKYFDQSENSDDEHAEALTFDIDSSQKGFYAKDEKLRRINCQWDRGGGMIEIERDTAQNYTRQGTLYGIMINDTTWLVSAELQFNVEFIAFKRFFIQTSSWRKGMQN